MKHEQALSKRNEKKKVKEKCLSCNRQYRINLYLCINCHNNFAIDNGVFGNEVLKLWKEENMKIDLTPRLSVPRTRKGVHVDNLTSNEYELEDQLG